MQVNMGGGTLPNAVFVDLSTNKTTAVKRDSWDFEFRASETDFYVRLNNTMKMAAKKLDITDITQPVTIDENVKVDPGAGAIYIDSPTGTPITRFGAKSRIIENIDADDSKNNVYLVNMGYNIATGEPQAGSVSLTGSHRGWLKIRVLRRGADYLFQYSADLEGKEYKEFTVKKNSEQNYTFVSVLTNRGAEASVVSVQPKSKEWDLQFSSLSNIIGATQTYFFSDIVLNNQFEGGVVHIDTVARDEDFTNYTKEKAIEKEKASSAYFAQQGFQFGIGSAWRNTMQRTINDQRLYLVKDAQGNYYILKFLSMMNDQSVRGNITFQYRLLK